MSNNDLSIFEGKKIRKIYDEKQEKWYFSIVDIIAVLTEQADFQWARNYWKVLKNRLTKEESQVVTDCNRLKMIAEDGKMRLTDVGSAETILRLVQSVPSKKAEPIKLWLAKVGYERIQEITEPELSIDRARENWQKAGRSEKWISQRMSGQETRNKLMDYWSESGVSKGEEFAILTNIIHSEWAGLSVKEHKNLKNLKLQNLRNHMTEAELIFTSLAELSTREIAESMKTEWLEQNKIPAKKWWQIARNARKELEAKTGKSVISGESFLKPKGENKKLK